MKALSTLLAAVIALQNSVFLHAAESNFWNERRSAKNAVVASLPAAHPAPAPVLNHRFSASLPHAQTVPVWMHTALAPFASIQNAHPAKNKNAKTVLLFQDAHLHSEAQANSAGALNAVARELEKNGKTVLVALEAAPAGKIDLSVYAAYPHRKEMGLVAQSLLEKKILNGAERAVIGYAAEKSGPVNLPFEVIGAEDWAGYQANVKAFREAHALKKKAQDELDKIARELAARKTILTPELAALDGKMADYADGSLGISAFAVYLDSIVPAAGPNAKELVNAALIEKSLNFDKVEAQRTRLVEDVAEKLTETEAGSLLQAGALLRSGQISSAVFYRFLTELTEKKGVRLARYPDMALYIQYTVKSEAIDAGALMTELRAWENEAIKKLAQNQKQLDLFADIRAQQLLNKLSAFELTLEEWTEASAIQRAPVFDSFKEFYRAALARNNSMADNVGSMLASSHHDYAVLVAGGFHADGLKDEFLKRGFHVVTVSPKITTTEKMPSSLELIASNRLPIDQLFVGERLFLDAPRSLVDPALPKIVSAAADEIFKASGTGEPYPFEEAIRAAVKKVGAREAMRRFEGLFTTDSAFKLPRNLTESDIRNSAVPNLLSRIKSFVLREPGALLYERDLEAWVGLVAQKLRALGIYRHERMLLVQMKTIAISEVDRILEVVMPILLKTKNADLLFLLGMRMPQNKQSQHIYQNILAAVKISMGIKESIHVSLYSNDPIKKLAQTWRVGTVYNIVVSEEYLAEHVLSEARIKTVMTAGKLTRADAERKLMEWYFEEEIVEGYWRYQFSDKEKDGQYQKLAHDEWQKFGLSALPVLAALPADFIKAKAGTLTAELMSVDAARPDNIQIFQKEAHAYFAKAFPKASVPKGPQIVPEQPAPAKRSVNFGAVGNYIARGSIQTNAEGKTTTIVQVIKGDSLVWQTQVPGEVTSFTMNPDQNIYVLGMLERHIRLYRLDTNATIYSVRLTGQHEYAVTDVKLSADNKTLVSTDASGLKAQYSLADRQPVGIWINARRGIVDLALLASLSAISAPVIGVTFFGGKETLSALSAAGPAMPVWIALAVGIWVGKMAITAILRNATTSFSAGDHSDIPAPRDDATSEPTRIVEKKPFSVDLSLLERFYDRQVSSSLKNQGSSRREGGRAARLILFTATMLFATAAPAMAGDGFATAPTPNDVAMIILLATVSVAAAFTYSLYDYATNGLKTNTSKILVGLGAAFISSTILIYMPQIGTVQRLIAIVGVSLMAAANSDEILKWIHENVRHGRFLGTRAAVGVAMLFVSSLLIVAGPLDYLGPESRLAFVGGLTLSAVSISGPNLLWVRKQISRFLRFTNLGVLAALTVAVTAAPAMAAGNAAAALAGSPVQPVSGADLIFQVIGYMSIVLGVFWASIGSLRGDEDKGPYAFTLRHIFFGLTFASILGFFLKTPVADVFALVGGAIVILGPAIAISFGMLIVGVRLVKAAAAGISTLNIIGKASLILAVALSVASPAMAGDGSAAVAMTPITYGWIAVIGIGALAAARAILKSRAEKKEKEGAKKTRDKIEATLTKLNAIFSIPKDMPIKIRAVIDSDMKFQRGEKKEVDLKFLGNRLNATFSATALTNIAGTNARLIQSGAAAFGLKISMDEAMALAVQAAVVRQYLSDQGVADAILEKNGFIEAVSPQEAGDIGLRFFATVKTFLTTDAMISDAEKILAKHTEQHVSATIRARFEEEAGTPLAAHTNQKAADALGALFYVQRLTIDQRFAKPVTLHFAHVKLTPGSLMDSVSLKEALVDNANNDGLVAQALALGLDLDGNEKIRLYDSRRSDDRTDTNIGEVPALHIIDFPDLGDNKKAAQYLLQALDVAGDKNSAIGILDRVQFESALQNIDAVTRTRINRRAVYLNSANENNLRAKKSSPAWNGDITAEIDYLLAKRTDLQKVSIYSDPTRPLSASRLSVPVSFFFVIPVEILGLDGQLKVFLLGAKQA